MFKTFEHWDVVVMLVLFGVVTGFEMLGVFNPHYITITRILKTFIPMPVRFMILSWLCWHFAVSDLVAQMTPKQ